MDANRDTCRNCGSKLRGVERKRGVCDGCRKDDGRVQK